MLREVLTKVVWLRVERPRYPPVVEETRALCPTCWGRSRRPTPATQPISTFVIEIVERYPFQNRRTNGLMQTRESP